MSIETRSVVYCDGCGHTAAVQGDTPGEARVRARRMGWHYTLGDGKMTDICPACWAKRNKGEK